ncbi:pantoate--beta-alanine ligase [Exiguobacterium sp. SH3S2]|uniref:pantoate--beta-alanine ligase n=1 Tax=unclassified Exiguobacterium TaxID=2644629 RepID=UPI00103DB4C6|nr:MULTISPECIES: pantoate--beta-alanine ligase [unclassified Exiguobacterium]TCI27346.1 pantoate--beta-alanine ligase [Exiguobacterium sp. SH5S4]TCI37259.1 pantoate--beta-alanine ligase [Exiguobacterium sp. SH4S7]TCI49332.1 pantoate--beta-alanine ligase [Exiguobacterium sp. SH3S3]TCI57876.1 pantoate--beta-alanine ligase [Exiguobacterium sp. SH5S13]TCI64645.1 pantoate--beta-alanine ligase [Exiguobacterium sp. SH3S2]
MRIVTDPMSLRETLSDGLTVGFVPTMGYLHEGHLSLVEAAKRENDRVVMSIFVNPTQFGPNEDLDRYPRDFERDEQLAREAGVDVLFYPDTATMYPLDMARVTVRTGADVLCGASRPGHFDGVLTVVSKLFNLVRPTRAYFGLKDAQQVALIEGYVRDYFVPVEIIRCPIIREDSGLAKSSRNVYLSETERIDASDINRALIEARDALTEGDAITSVQERLVERLSAIPNSTIDYVELVDYPTLSHVTDSSTELLIAVAVQFERARLIDNTIWKRG